MDGTTESCNPTMMKVRTENGVTTESPLTASKNKKRHVDGEESGDVVVSLEAYIKKLQIENTEVKAENVELKAENAEVKTEIAEINAKNVEGEAKNAELKALVETLKQRHSNQEQEDDDDDLMSDDDDSTEDVGSPWNIKYKQLRQYRMVKGDCQVSKGYKQNPKLGTWVHNQRSHYGNVQTGKKGQKITQERIEKLDSIGFFWGMKYSTGTERSFKDYISELQKYKATMGTFNVHPNHELGKWITRLRAEYKLFKKGQPALITLDQIQELKKIGFRWKRQTK
jgi:hypothetical protein